VRSKYWAAPSAGDKVSGLQRTQSVRKAAMPRPVFQRTECVAGVQDARFQQLMPDVVHWLGLKRIVAFVSMSDMKARMR